MLFGLAPALQAGHVNLNELLKEGGRSGAGGRAAPVARCAWWLPKSRLALVLLVGAGLLMRSFWKLQQADPGFNPERVLTASLSLPSARYSRIAEGRRVSSAIARTARRLARRSIGRADLGSAVDGLR